MRADIHPDIFGKSVRNHGTHDHALPEKSFKNRMSEALRESEAFFFLTFIVMTGYVKNNLS